MRILEKLSSRILPNLFGRPQCAHRECDRAGDHPRTLVNASTGDKMDVHLCSDHRDLVRQYDRENRQARKIP